MGIWQTALARLGYAKTADAKTKGVAGEWTTSSDAFTTALAGNQYNQSFSSFNNQKQQLNSYTDWVYIAVRAIAEQCAAIDLRIYENHTKLKSTTMGLKLVENPRKALDYQQRRVTQIEYDKMQKRFVLKTDVAALEEIETHPLLELLNCPNPFMTKNEFFETTFLHLELTGESFWAVNRDKKGIPNELWPLMPNLIQVVPDKTHFIVGYLYTINGQQVPFAPDDIIHHKYSNPVDFRRGYSGVMAGARTVDADAHAADWNRKILYNDATPAGILSTDETMDDTTFKRIKQEWLDTYGGTNNVHKTALLEAGIKYQQMSMTHKDMDFSNLRNYNRDQILALFGVPKSIVGLVEDFNRANSETAEYTFVKGRIKPKMQRLCNRITEDLAPQFDQRLIISFTDPVPDDKEFLLKETQAALGYGGSMPYVAVNEERAKRGDPLIPGADELMVPSTFVPLGQLLKEPIEQEQASEIQENDNEKPELDNTDNETDDTDTNDTANSGSGGNSNTPSSADSSGSTTSESTNGSGSQASITNQAAVIKIAASEFPSLYDGLGIDTAKLGCIMMNVQLLPITRYVSGAQQDLVTETTAHNHTLGAVGETAAHVTLLFGLLENGNVWKDKVDTVLRDWELKTVTIDHVDAFDLNESYAIVAHVKKTPELIDGHERLTLLPHVQTFSEYKPHITLAYVTHDEAVKDKWVQALSVQYNGKTVPTTSINYGDLPDKDSAAGKMLTKSPLPVADGCTRCACCGGYGEHDTGYECYRCDASGSVTPFEAEEPIPCAGRADGLWQREDSDKALVFSPSPLVQALKANDHINSPEHVELPAFPSAIPDSEVMGSGAMSAPTGYADSADETPQDRWNNDMQKYLTTRGRLVQGFELQFMRGSRERFLEQKHEVLKAVHERFGGEKAIQRMKTKADKKQLNDLFDEKKNDAAWAALLLPVYTKLNTDAGMMAIELVNNPEKYGYDAVAPASPIVYDTNSSAIEEYFANRAGTVSKGINDETDRMLRATLTEGINAGESIAELSDRVENVYGAATGYRSQRIARTESQQALHYASQQAWEQSGLVATYIWICGDNPCPTCEALNNTTATSYNDFPDEHISGQCDVIPDSFVTASEAQNEVDFSDESDTTE